MKPTRRVIRRSFMSEVTGGFGKAGPPGAAGAGKPVPATDADLFAGEHAKPLAGDSDRSSGGS